MPNNSSTGGYLAPTTLDLNDQELRRLVQGVVAGITGLFGDLVFQSFQGEPPTLPDFGTDWAAVDVRSTEPDFDLADFISNGSDVPDSKYGNEEITVLASFYGPNCQKYGEVLRVGFQVGQNREQLQLDGFGFVAVESVVLTGDMLHSRWVRRVDVTFRLRRAQEYTYDILTLLGTEVTVKDDSGAVNLEIELNQ